MKRLSAQSGQATAELTVMLVAITAMILGIIFLCGLEITGNQQLLEARCNAQKRSRETGGTTVSGNEYLSWEYTTLDLGKQNIVPGNGGSGTDRTGNSTELYRGRRLYVNREPVTIPFTMNSTATTGKEDNTLASTASGFQSPLYSANADRDWEDFRSWNDLQHFSSGVFRSDFAAEAGSANALAATRLITAAGDSGSGMRVGTLSRSDQAGEHSSDDAADVMYDTFARWFGIRISSLKNQENEMNRVYLPAGLAPGSLQEQ